MRSQAPHKKGCPIPQESGSLEGFPATTYSPTQLPTQYHWR